MVQKYSLEKYVRFIGAFSYMEALKKMSTYNVLVIIEADMKDGIFLPSKVTDYSQLGVPIFAITPQKSCISRLIDTYGGGVTADCSSVNFICAGIEELYHDWKSDLGMKKYDTTKLYSNFKPENIIENYKTIFNEMGI